MDLPGIMAQGAIGHPWRILALALDLAGLAMALWVIGSRRHPPGHSRLFVGLGLLVAALAPLLADALPTARPVSSSSDFFVPLRWIGATLALGLLASAIALASTPRARHRWLLRLALAAAMVAIPAGGGLAWLASAGVLPARWAPIAGAAALSVVAAGGLLALLGAAATLALVALGRTPGSGSRAMRLRLALAAAIYAAAIAGGPPLASTLAGAGAMPGEAIVALVAALAVAGLVALALTTRRVLLRAVAGSGVAVAPFGSSPRHKGARRPLAPPVPRTPARIAPALPKGTLAVEPLVVGPAARLDPTPPPPATAFAAPALRRTLLDEQPARATAGYDAPHLVYLPRSPAPAVPVATAARDATPPASEAATAAGSAPSAADGATGPERPTAQFLASLARLQADLARQGYPYTIQQLLDALNAITPPTARTSLD